jgi:hypothetical protein
VNALSRRMKNVWRSGGRWARFWIELFVWFVVAGR